VPATVWIAEDGDHELIQIQLEPSSGNSVTMTLSKWGEPVTVDTPAP
jgi:lipoprotein LprG